MKGQSDKTWSLLFTELFDFPTKNVSKSHVKLTPQALEPVKVGLFSNLAMEIKYEIKTVSYIGFNNPEAAFVFDFKHQNF